MNETVQKHPLLDQSISDFKLRNNPYDIQIGFMNDMLKCFEDGKIGFFESPTGTGKSLSVICSSLSFLRKKNEPFERKNDESESSEDFDDDLFNEDKPKPFQLLISTRTHSQIKEMVTELKSLKKAAENKRTDATQRLHSLMSQEKLSNKNLNHEIRDCKNEISDYNKYLKTFPRCVSLSSRQNLCVNSSLRTLSPAELNEHCNSKCPFYDENSFKKFSHHIHEAPMDIEDLYRYGESHSVCPYFSCREAIKHSDVILLPYQTLFQQNTRDALNLSIDRSYIVVDEAHNLVDALNALYTVSIVVEDIEKTCDNILKYRAKIQRLSSQDKVLAESTTEERKLDTKNLSVLYQVLFSIRKALNDKNENHVMTMNQFQINYKIKVGNTFSLINWAKESHIVYKCCHHFHDEKEKISYTEAFRRCINFIEMIGNTDDMGTVVINKSQLSYLLLNPSTVFTDVSSHAQSIALVGGTLQPLEDVIFQLTQSSGKSNSDKIMTHCNGHVIPKENCLCICAQQSPTKICNLFTYDKRNSKNAFDSICEAIVDLSKRIPYGVIIFFTSKPYMASVYEHLVNEKSTISGKKYISIIQDNLKFVLCEQSDQKENNNMIKAFKAHVDDEKIRGAILFAVINGKLSEGINFANDYCRCVMVVGMPYPDSNDIVLKQRMEFFNQKFNEHKTQCDGKMFYENLCMRAVNQSIGRSFRNINDYSVVVLFDSRYKDHSQNLPSWILRSYHNAHTWEEVDHMIDDFFKNRK